MFCPKCRTENPDDGKFCRKCGNDISAVSDAKKDKPFVLEDWANTNMAFVIGAGESDDGKKKVSWESAMGRLFLGIAFIVVSAILAFQPSGIGWWFWLMIPGFLSLGAGTAQILRITYGTNPNAAIDQGREEKQISNEEKSALPPKQTEYASDVADTDYKTGDLVPPGVAEGTTRHLEMDPEGETMTLPKDKTD